MSVLDTVNMINKATGFNPPPAPTGPPVAPVLNQINQATGFSPHPAVAPLQLFHQTFMAPPNSRPSMPPPTPQNAMDQISAIMAQNQQTMAQNEAAIQSGQHHLLQPLQMLPQMPQEPQMPTSVKKLPIYTNK